MLSFQYPDVYRDETAVQDYHGHKICDPYVWLEDPDSEQTKYSTGKISKIVLGKKNPKVYILAPSGCCDLLQVCLPVFSGELN